MIQETYQDRGSRGRHFLAFGQEVMSPHYAPLDLHWCPHPFTLHKYRNFRLIWSYFIKIISRLAPPLLESHSELGHLIISVCGNVGSDRVNSFNRIL